MGLGSNHFRYSLQRSLPKEEDIKQRYEAEKTKAEYGEGVTDRPTGACTTRAQLYNTGNTLALQMQQEYERAERHGTDTSRATTMYSAPVDFLSGKSPTINLLRKRQLSIIS